MGVESSRAVVALLVLNLASSRALCVNFRVAWRSSAASLRHRIKHVGFDGWREGDDLACTRLWVRGGLGVGAVFGRFGFLPTGTNIIQP